MQFVMVPVPEDHVVDVMQYVARLVARASIKPWEPEDVDELFRLSDEVSRSLLSLVARAAVADKEITEEQVAKQLELNMRDIRAVMSEISDRARDGNREPVVASRETSVVLPNNRTVQRRIVVMAEPVARMLRAAERAVMEAEGHPVQRKAE